MRRRRSPVGDRPLRELDALVDALRRNRDTIDRIIERADVIRTKRLEQGLDYHEIIRLEDRPLIVELLTENQHRLVEAGSRWRRAEAVALREEGLTLDDIASLFGVTRQRASQLVHDKRP
ncbi:MAG TPA: helix-turn-helix domain-containing protein [Mycobacteriales bacterium]|nr:helix-turn-helix domain-containing protein [Mycobacteriales bacterium]